MNVHYMNSYIRFHRSQKQLISKEISRAQHKYMNIPPPSHNENYVTAHMLVTYTIYVWFDSRPLREFAGPGAKLYLEPP